MDGSDDAVVESDSSFGTLDIVLAFVVAAVIVLLIIKFKNRKKNDDLPNLHIDQS